MIVKTDFQNKIQGLLPEIVLRFNEPLSKHTSFRIGGPVEVMAFPKNPEELIELLKVSALLDCKTAILGAGTNVLAPDSGLEGLVICLKDSLDGMEVLEDNCIRVAAGVTMTRAAVFAAKHNLSGLEFAHGIPGTIGGGIYMNAGAYGSELKDVCKCVDVMRRNGEIETIPCEEMDFSYRHSCLERSQGIVLRAVFALHSKPEAEIKKTMQDLSERRRANQPLDYPSAGSAFKRPSVGYAAELIDKAGLKGFQIGGAAVSEKHAGFIINLSNASAGDVKAVLEQVAQKVNAQFGVELEPEIRIW